MMKVHISLRVKDVNASRRFYEAFLGVPAHKVRPGYANFDVNDPPLKLALTQSEMTGQGTLDHLGFVVETREQVDEARQRMLDAGLTTFSEEEVTCCYATQDKVWVTDPDGHSWEVYVLLDDSPPDSFKGRPMTMLPGFRQPGNDSCC